MTVSRKLTIRDIAEELNIAYGSAQEILVNPFVTSAGYIRHPRDDLCVRYKFFTLNCIIIYNNFKVYKYVVM